MAIVTIASSLAKKIEDFLIADTNNVYTNERSEKNKYNNSKPKPIGRAYT